MHIFIEDKFLTKFNNITFFDIESSGLLKLIIFIASTSKWEFFIFDFDDCNGTFSVTLFSTTGADKRFTVFNFSVYQSVKIKILFLYKTKLDPLFNFKSNSECTHQSRLGWNNNFFPGKCRHRDRNCFVVTDSSLHKNFFSNRTIPFYTICVIQTDRIDQSGNNVLF